MEIWERKYLKWWDWKFVYASKNSENLPNKLKKNANQWLEARKLQKRKVLNQIKETLIDEDEQWNDEGKFFFNCLNNEKF